MLDATAKMLFYSHFKPRSRLGTILSFGNLYLFWAVDVVFFSHARPLFPVPGTSPSERYLSGDASNGGGHSLQQLDWSFDGDMVKGVHVLALRSHDRLQICPRSCFKGPFTRILDAP
jgi:hypothetical protein